MNKVSSIYTACVRCGKRCQAGKNKNPDARPFREAEKGLCVNCAVTSFLLCDDLEWVRISLEKNGVKILKIPAIQAQFADILAIGSSELSFELIDWDTVINQWDLPFPKGYKPHREDPK